MKTMSRKMTNNVDNDNKVDKEGGMNDGDNADNEESDQGTSGEQ